MFSLLSSTAYSLDFFKSPISFLISGKEKQNSWMGLFLSLFIIGMIAYNALNSDLLLRKNPLITSQTITTEPRPFIYFSSENFSIFLTIRDTWGLTYNDPTIFRIQTVKAGIEVKSLKILQYEIDEMIKCDNNSFKNSNQTFDSLSAVNAFCPKNSTFKLGGYLDQEFSFKYGIEVLRCVNTSKFNNCKSEEEITKFFDQKYINIYVEGRNFDLNDLEIPIRPIYTTHFVTTDNKLYKIVNFFMRKVEVLSDEHYWDNDIKTTISYEMAKENYDMNYIEKSTKIVTFSFFTSLEKTQLIRKYQKLTNLFSQLGGLAHILMFLGYFFIIIYRRYNLRHLIVSSLYYFQPLNKSKQIDESKRNFLLELSSFLPTSTKKIDNKNNSNNYLTTNHEENLGPIINKSNFSKNNIDISHIHLDTFQNNNEISACIPSKILNTTINEEFLNGSSKEINKIHRSFPIKPENIEPDIPVILENYSQEDIKTNKENQPQNLKKNEITICINKEKENNIKKKSLKKKFNFSNKQKSGLEKLVENEDYKKLYFSFWDYIKYYFKKILKIKKNDHQKLFEKSNEIFLKEFEIIEVMKKLKEIDRIKRILFNNDQIYLFNLLEKEMIFIDEEKKHKEDINFNMIKMAYENIMGLDDPFLFNKRLIEITNERIREFNEYANV